MILIAAAFQCSLNPVTRRSHPGRLLRASGRSVGCIGQLGKLQEPVQTRGSYDPDSLYQT
jgi:hypothetical protein